MSCINFKLYFLCFIFKFSVEISVKIFHNSKSNIKIIYTAIPRAELLGGGITLSICETKLGLLEGREEKRSGNLQVNAIENLEVSEIKARL